MLIDWPDQKIQLAKLIEEAIQARAIGVARVAALASHFTINEGEKVELVAPDGSRSDVQFEPHEASVKISREEILSSPGGNLLHAVNALGETIGEEMDKNLLATVRKSHSSVTTMFGGHTTKELGQQLLAGLRTMDVDFDDDGKPQLSLVVHPDTFDRLIALNEDVELEREIEQVLQEKRHEWIRRESRRRLAD